MSFFKMLLGYFRERKKFWLVPIILFLLLLGSVLFVAETPIAPLIYTMF